MSDQKVMLKTDRLRKEFKGITAVDDLDLELEKGDIFGLIGTNGSGKTTIIKMLATLLKPTSGSAYIGGYDVFREPEKVRGIIGYMPEFLSVYTDLKVFEYLEFFAAAYKIPRHNRIGFINDVMELTELNVKRNSYIRELSRGMRQRLCLAKTLLHDPQLLLLDEPASGLDPRGRFEIREIFKELGNMGKTLFITSNIIHELAGFCNKIGIIEKGKLLLSGDMNQVLSSLDSDHKTTLSLEEAFFKVTKGDVS